MAQLLDHKRWLVFLSLFILFFLAAFPSKAQTGNRDLCKVTIESIKCIKPSTGQDVYTKFLFKGIELALTAAKAVATAGTSLTVDAAIEIAKTAAKSAIKSAAEITIKNQDFYKTGQDKLLDAVKKQGNGNPAMSFVMDGVQTYLTYTSLEGIFNKVYGESPDDLYITVNGNKVWPSSGDGVSISSQQNLAVGAEYIFEKSQGLTIRLMEYDWGSGDDFMGGLTWTYPPNFIGDHRLVDQLIQHEEEGSVYFITFRVESVLKHRYINEIPGTLWDQTLDGKPINTIAFGATEITNGGDGVTWKIVDVDKIQFCKNNSPYLNITFHSETSATGSYIHQQGGAVQTAYAAKKRPWDHQSAKNIIGSTWDYYWDLGEPPILMEIGDGTINFPQLNERGITWKFRGKDYMYLKNSAKSSNMALFFESENTFKGKSWDGVTFVYGKRRAGASSQQQNQQTLQHRFITNIVGTSWNFSDPAWGAASFTFGPDKLINVNPAGTFWDSVTWKVAGTDIIELRTSNGATMNIGFTDQNNFSGYSWYDKTKVATGSILQQQVQTQQQETFPHRYINNIIGSSWTYTEPGGGVFTFTFGNRVIVNFSAPGTYWDQVTWSVAGTDIIELQGPNGSRMNLIFSDAYNFSGTFWNNGTSPISGSRR